MGWNSTHVFGPVVEQSFDVATQTQDSRREVIKMAQWLAGYWYVIWCFLARSFCGTSAQLSALKT